MFPFFSKTIQFLVLSTVFSGGLVFEKYWFSIAYIAVCIGLLN